MIEKKKIREERRGRYSCAMVYRSYDKKEICSLRKISELFAA